MKEHLSLYLKEKVFKRILSFYDDLKILFEESILTHEIML
jgi:hypothetical protein